jgi:DNA-binding XRE family transcriptional regulator
MARTGISDEMLAETVGTSRATISRLRRGKLVPSLRLAREISEATGGYVTADDFFDNLPVRPPARLEGGRGGAAKAGVSGGLVR